MLVANDLYYAGDIDEVRIWSDVRTATEISSNRYLCLSGTEPNLEAYYKMDDGPGTSLADYSGNGRTGTLFGMNSNTSWIGSGPVIDCYCGEGRRDTLIATVYPILRQQHRGQLLPKYWWNRSNSFNPTVEAGPTTTEKLAVPLLTQEASQIVFSRNSLPMVEPTPLKFKTPMAVWIPSLPL